MRSKRLSVEERVTAVARLAGMAHRHYEVWRVYTAPESRERLLDAMDGYADFVNLDEHGHRALALLYLASVFDRQKNAVRLQDLFDDIQGRAPEAVARARLRLDQAQAVITKVLKIRHGAIAHRTAAHSHDTVYADAALTADQLRDLIADAAFIARELATACGVEPPLIAVFAPMNLAQLFADAARGTKPSC